MELSQEKEKNVSIVTVVTPSFNSGHFLITCIDGVAKQCVPGMSIEHLIIDNNSTDDTKSIIESVTKVLPDGITLQFICESDNGHHEAITKGIMLADSPYIAICNASDYYVNERWLTDAIYFMEKRKVDCVWSMNFVVNEGHENNYEKDGVGAVGGIPFSYHSYKLKDYLVHSVGFSEVTAVFKRGTIQSLMPMTRPMHPWLYVQYDFFTRGFMSMFIPVIASVTRRHKDSLAAQNGDDAERKAFAEIDYLIGIYRRANFASLAD